MPPTEIHKLSRGIWFIKFFIVWCRSEHMRIKFNKDEQRKFIDEVLRLIGCPSLRELINRGIESKYSSLKNYYSERRILPQNLFESLIKISGIDKRILKFELLPENWGKIKGGKN